MIAACVAYRIAQTCSGASEHSIRSFEYLRIVHGVFVFWRRRGSGAGDARRTPGRIMRFFGAGRCRLSWHYAPSRRLEGTSECAVVSK